MKANQKQPEIIEGIHLNIGCGQKVWNGFVNIDFPDNYSGRRPDIECDIRNIPLPDNHADSAYAIHVLEHFYRYETEEVLKEWVRILKPGGKLIIEVPCLDKIIKLFSFYILNNKPINGQLTMWALYGDPKYKEPNMVHKWCFSTSELMEIMRSVGLKEIEYSTPEFHVSHRDIRVTGIK